MQGIVVFQGVGRPHGRHHGRTHQEQPRAHPHWQRKGVEERQVIRGCMETMEPHREKSVFCHSMGSPLRSILYLTLWHFTTNYLTDANCVKKLIFCVKIVSSQTNIRNTFFDQRSPWPLEVGVSRRHRLADRQTDKQTDGHRDSTGLVEQLPNDLR